MGIFEKSIPKYTYNLANEVVVDPQDVYVDDIFDPIFNARVNDAMRQKYGDGLYGVVGGYEELLKNTWTGREGIFGPGMGLLSTFGRSMEKADDVILGALTEGIKGLSGQGAVNPIENIFVNDVDYTGRGLLAATTNIASPLMGGTRVDESDFGSAWTIPALGLELGTDVGILGGTLSRKLAPSASKLTSKQLFENLGKSDLKTSVGEIGQLMSNYDDLMTKVALDVSAPGLRPAMKGLMNRIAEMVGHQSSNAFANAQRSRTSSGNGSGDDIATGLVKMFVDLDNTLKTLPVSEADELSAASRKTSDIVSETVANAPYNALKHGIESAPAKQVLIEDPFASFRTGLETYEKTKNEKLGESIEELQKLGVPIEQVGIDTRQGFTTESLEEVRELVTKMFLNEYSPEAFRTVKDIEVPRTDGIADPGRFFAFLPEPHSGNMFQNAEDILFYTDAFDTLAKNPIPRNSKGNIVIKREQNIIPQSNPSRPFQEPLTLHRSYIDDVIDKLSTDEKLQEALETEVWSDYEPINNLMHAILSDPKRKDSLYYPVYNDSFTVSPSLLAKLQMPEVPDAISKAYALLDATRHVGGDPSLPRFQNVDEFNTFMNSDNMTTALNAMFPPKTVDSFTRSKHLVEDLDSLNTDLQDVRIRTFKKRLKDVMYPDNKNVKDAYTALKDLSDFFDSNTDVVDPILASSAPSEFEFLQDLYKATDSIGSNFIDPLEGFGVTSRDSRKMRFIEELDSTPKDLTNSFKTNVDDYAKTILNTAARHIRNLDDLKKVIAPLTPYYQISLKRNHLFDFANETKSNAVVDSFIDNVFPLAEEYTRKGGQLYSLKNNTYYPKYMSKSKVDALKNYLGWGDNPDENSESFIMLLNEVFKGSKYAPNRDAKESHFGTVLRMLKSDGQLKVVNGKFTPDTVKRIRSKLSEFNDNDFGFKPTRDISEYLDSAPDLDVDKTVSSIDDMPRDLLGRIRTPKEMLDVLKSESSSGFRKSVSRSNTSGQLSDYAYAEFERTVITLEHRLSDLGFGSQKELHDLLDKAKSLGKRNLYKLPIDEYRKLNAYAMEYYKTVGSLPYYSVTRDIVDFKPEAGFGALYRAVDGLEKPANMSDVQFAKTKRRLNNLLNDELLTHFKADKTDTLRALRTPYEDYFSPFLDRIDRYGVHKSLSDIERGFVTEVEKALETGNLHKLDSIRKKYYAKARHAGHSTAFIKSFTDKLGWTARTAPSEFAYTPGNVEFVRKNLIEHLPNKYRTAWRPSSRNGLFYFDMHLDEKPDVIRISENFDIHPENLQLMERLGMDFDTAIVSDAFAKRIPGKKTYTPYLGYFDYSKITPEGRKDMSRILGNREIRMNLFTQFDAPARFGTISDVLVDSVTAGTPAAKVVENVQDTIVKAAPDEASKLAYETVSVQHAAVEASLRQIIGDEATDYLKNGGDPTHLKNTIPEEKWDLFEQIAKADAVSSINSFRKNRATLRQKPVQAVLERAFKLRGDHLMKGGKMADFRRFVALRQQPYGDIVQGKDFWNELRHSGMLGAVYAKGNANADAVFDSLTKNANIINELVKHPIVKVVREDIPNDKQKIYLQFVKNKKGVVWINDAAEKLEKAAFETVTFSPPKAWTAEDLAFMNSDTMRELSAIMDEAQVLAADQAKYLGFTFDTSSQYTKHAMRRNTDTALWFNDTFYKDFSSEDLDEFVNCISNLERYRKADHGAFGTTVNTRRFRGDVWMMDDGPNVRFNYDPYEMITSTLADGTFANLQFQSYVDLFMNDNFKIKEWFHSIDDLKEVLYKTTEDGRVSGNLRNLELCTMRLDANGKIIGLTKYDKLSDAGLQKALADENCILVPTNAVSHIDNLLKKDIRMSNKLWTFVNKHFTIPFKFGVLSNPGFLLGNMSDASLKLATTMSQKYGTTVKAEAARVAGCIQRAGKYKEDYGTAFEVWRKVYKDNGIKLSPEATIPDIVSMSPKYNEQFLEWLDGRLRVEKLVEDPITGKVERIEVIVPCDLSDNVKNAASTWVMLQTAQMNSSKLREFADIAGLANTSEFEMPTNLWDLITQGKGKYSKHKPSTWGLFMNNPATSAMLNASTGWEDVIRTASILDDLEHGYTFEELGILSRAPKGTQSDINFRVKLDEAKNTMYNAQFDYERGSDFMEGVGKAVPFPVFFLKNFAYWMELFAENPQYVDNAIDIQEGLWGNRDEENAKDTFAIEAKGRGAIPVGGESLPEWFKGYYKPAPLQSMFGAFNLLNDPIGNMQYRVNPLISSGIAAVNKTAPNELTTSLAPTEETKYRPYSTDMYERNVKASDPNFNPLEYAVHRANPYERALNSYLRVPHKIREGEVQMSDFAPSIFQPDF